MNENGRRAVAPSEGAQATERGWVFPRPMIRSEGGASEWGRRGKTKAGDTAASRLPAAHENPRAARPAGKRTGVQRRALSPAGNVTRLSLSKPGAVPGRAPFPASKASGAQDLLMRSDSLGKFPTPWITPTPSGDITRLRD